MENYVIIAVIIAIVIFWVFAKMRRVNELNSWLDVKGVNINHNYSNVLGVATKSGQVFLYTDVAYLFHKSERRSLERSSIFETRFAAH